MAVTKRHRLFRVMVCQTGRAGPNFPKAGGIYSESPSDKVVIGHETYGVAKARRRERTICAYHMIIPSWL